MSLESLVRQLNAEFAAATWRSTQRRQPMQVEQGRVIGHFRGLCLRSSFAPIVDLNGGLLGYQAQLQVTDRRRPLPPWVPYAMACLEDRAVISLDRLCRTLHALNGLTHAASGWLLLDVHPRHIQEVRQGHGRVFEYLLRRCGLQPRQIVLRFQVAGTMDLSHLGLALERFRARGFAIALVHPGDAAPNQFKLLLDLAPDFIHLERPRRVLAGGALAARLVSQVLRAHHCHCQVLVQGIDSPVQADLAWLVGVDGIQGEYAERCATDPATASHSGSGAYGAL